MSLQDLRKKALAIHGKAKEENRSLNSDEHTELQNVIAEIEKQTEKQKAYDEAIAQYKREQDALEREREVADADADGIAKSLNSFESGSYTVGSGEFSSDVVEKFGLGSAFVRILTPENVIRTSHGNNYSVPVVAAGSGEARDESESGSTDSTNSFTSVDLNTARYGSKVIPVSIEHLSDSEYDVEAHVINMGLDRCGRAFDAAITSSIQTAATAGVYDTGSDGTLDLSDVVGAWVENCGDYVMDRGNVKIMTTQAVKGAWQSHKDDNGRPDYDDWLKVLGIEKVVTNPNVTTNTALVGNFDEGVKTRVVTSPIVSIWDASAVKNFEIHMRAVSKLVNADAIVHAKTS